MLKLLTTSFCVCWPVVFMPSLRNRSVASRGNERSLEAPSVFVQQTSTPSSLLFRRSPRCFDSNPPPTSTSLLPLLIILPSLALLLLFFGPFLRPFLAQTRRKLPEPRCSWATLHKSKRRSRLGFSLIVLNPSFQDFNRLLLLRTHITQSSR